jgi:hypothetical protein
MVECEVVVLETSVRFTPTAFEMINIKKEENI